jgi:hypothetical protein
MGLQLVLCMEEIFHPRVWNRYATRKFNVIEKKQIYSNPNHIRFLFLIIYSPIAKLKTNKGKEFAVNITSN